MTRPVAGPPSGITREPAAAPPEPPPAGLSRGWRVALFIWASAFVGLAAYELLTTLVRTLGRLF